MLPPSERSAETCYGGRVGAPAGGARVSDVASVLPEPGRRHMPLDPQIEAVLEEMRAAGAKPFEELSVPEARIAALAFKELQGEPEGVAAVGHHFTPGPTAALPIRIYTPEGP